MGGPRSTTPRRERNAKRSACSCLNSAGTLRRGTRTARPPLHLAAMRHSSEVVAVLVKELGANVHAKDNKGRTPLHVAAGCADNETAGVLGILNEVGADANAKDDSGATPLHVVAKMGHYWLARSLVREYGADVNAKDNSGKTPLCLAEEYEHYETARILIKELM